MAHIVPMTVEVREPDSAHAVPPPNLSEEHILDQLCKTIQLNGDAKLPGWRQTTYDILIEETPFVEELTGQEIKDSIREVLGYRSWAEVVKFVQDDECEEFFTALKRWAKRVGATLRENLDFIDGAGIGHNKLFNDRAKVTLEQAFDAKYFYKVNRPLDMLKERGMDIVDNANFLHPGHYSYPAGHGTKFLTSLEVLLSAYDLTPTQYRTALIASCVSAHGRCGSLIHLPHDNLEGGRLTTLPEFQ